MQRGGEEVETWGTPCEWNAGDQKETREGGTESFKFMRWRKMTKLWEVCRDQRQKGNEGRLEWGKRWVRGGGG